MEQSRNKKPIIIAAVIFVLLIITVVVLWILKSGNKKSEDSGSVAVKTTIDSTSMNVSSDSIKFVNFTSSDLMMHGLHGKVSRVVYTEGEGTVTEIYDATFDTLGVYVSAKAGPYGGVNTVIERNGSDQIVHIKDPKEPYTSDDMFDYKYKYNSQGQVSAVEGFGWEWHDKFDYIWDENGSLKKSGTGSDDGGSWESTSTFQCVAFDQYHNWTEAKCTVKSRSKLHGGDYGDWETRTFKVKREIEYFPR